MSVLQPPPSAVVDPATGTPALGAYRGPLPPVDLRPLGRGRLYRLLHHKRWTWVGIAHEDALAGLAIVDLGYLATTFGWAYDLRAGRMLADASALGPGFCGAVGDRAEEGCRARFRRGRQRSRVERPAGATVWEVEASLGGLRLRARLDAAGAPPPLAAIATPPGSPIATTQKRSLLAVTGELSVAGRRISLEGAQGGIDYSNGYAARHTVWKWSFGLGHDARGERLGWNLVEGFVGEAECAVWIGDELLPVGEARFEFDGGDPLRPWRVRSADGAVDLAFAPGAVHRERKNLGLIASRFLQAVGRYSGTIVLPGRRPLTVDGVPGVAEDQDMLW